MITEVNTISDASGNSVKLASPAFEYRGKVYATKAAAGRQQELDYHTGQYEQAAADLEQAARDIIVDCYAANRLDDDDKQRLAEEIIHDLFPRWHEVSNQGKAFVEAFEACKIAHENLRGLAA